LEFVLSALYKDQFQFQHNLFAPDQNMKMEDEAQKIKVLYIAGCDRSGSTLLDCTLGQVKGFFAGGEVWHFFGRGMVNNELCGCGQHFRECELWADVAKRYEAAGHEQGPADMERLLRCTVKTRYLPMILSSYGPSHLGHRLDILRAHLSDLYSVICEVTSCEVVVDSSKNPVYAHVLGGVDGVELYVVHLVRESRGVAYSWSKRKRRPEVPWKVQYMDRHGPAKSSLFWLAAQLGAETLKLKYPYIRVRYEDFIRDPRDIMASLLQFLGQGDADMEYIKEDALTLGVQHTISGNPMRMEQEVTLRMDCDWLTRMKKSDKMLVTALTLPLLVKYGYIGRPVP
jgi:hypothetical protein